MRLFVCFGIVASLFSTLAQAHDYPLETIEGDYRVVNVQHSSGEDSFSICRQNPAVKIRIVFDATLENPTLKFIAVIPDGSTAQLKAVTQIDRGEIEILGGDPPYQIDRTILHAWTTSDALIGREKQTLGSAFIPKQLFKTLYEGRTQLDFVPGVIRVSQESKNAGDLSKFMATCELIRDSV